MNSPHQQTKPSIAENMLDLISNTPLVKLHKLVDSRMATVYGKLEFFNPGGSIKDRICLSMIRDAEKKGLLHKDSVVIEPTSGNTGIGLALVCAVKGYSLILTMPDTMSIERRQLLKRYGAELVLTPGAEGMKGAIEKAQSIAAETKHSFIPQQFINPANPQIHRETTAEEIWTALDGKVDAFVAGVGTGGTITGCGEVFKQRNPDVKIVAVEPKGSPVLSGGTPGKHKIQGIGAGFIPEVLNRKIIDQVIPVTDEDAWQTANQLAKQEGILSGISTGAIFWAAFKVARELGPGKNLVAVVCDTGERYLSMDESFKEA
ncbi:MAG: cysteine synthase A [Candidatus Omnitrophica bacterium]|nr:cysteine synthase A [Candidatus Omnitrophota bacterium]MDD5670320.1 cysteine synthase A [Candidatus Omnitrophota bacterium]